MTVLITGASGQLGSDLARLLPDAVALSRERLDIGDESALRAAFEAHAPTLVFNCAADNAVDAAEAEPERAFRVNALGPGLLAAACASARARFVHFSTNYVFDGAKPAPYVETDAVSPLGRYAESKAAGERRVLAELPAALVIRSSGLYGVVGSAVKGGSFPERIIRSAREGKPLRVVDDQVLNPTYTLDLAERALELAGEGVSGVVHVVPEGCASYWELAAEALRLAGVGVAVERVRTGEFAVRAPRPLNGCLESVRVGPLRHWREGLRAWWSEFSGR